MNCTERLYKIDQLICDRKVVSFDALRESLDLRKSDFDRPLRNAMKFSGPERSAPGSVIGSEKRHCCALMIRITESRCCFHPGRVSSTSRFRWDRSTTSCARGISCVTTV